MSVLNRIMSVLLVEAIILCLITSYVFINNPLSAANIQSTATLAIFNILFISLIFRLNGPLNRKLCLLALGNAIGLCWNYTFNSLNVAGTVSFGETFNKLYIVFFPFLNSIWLVSFWSLSLSILRHESSSQRKFHDD